MWKWKFIKLAKFGPSSVPDITFTYYTCTECEPEVLFASLYFDSSKSAWQIRSWGDGNDPWWTAKEGLVVDMDLAASEEISSSSPRSSVSTHYFHLSPFPATLTRSSQLHDNTTTLSPAFATLTDHPRHKAFVWHSCKKHPRWGAVEQVEQALALFSVPAASRY
jgi:hypothetical protein